MPGAVPSERLWNEAQIRAAVEDTVQGLYKQLEALQVLDGTASSWPGVNQAIADLKETVEYLQEQGRKLVAGKDLAERRAEELRMELLTTASKLEGRERSNEELEQALRVESEAGGSLQVAAGACRGAGDGVGRPAAGKPPGEQQADPGN